MSSTFHRLVAAATLCATFAATSALALPFGSNKRVLTQRSKSVVAA